MNQPRAFVSRLIAASLGCLSFCSLAQASQFDGTLFFTRSTGGVNVNKITYNYDDSTHSMVLGSTVGIASTPGADGIIFAPNGNLLVGGQGSGNVYQVNPTTGSYTASPTGGLNSFHLSLDPSGTSVWTSPFGGQAINLSLTSWGSAPTIHNITGADSGITSLVFTPGGKTFYVNGQPNDGGNFGIIDMTTFQTTRIYTGVSGGHGATYDPYNGMILLAGGSHIVEINPTTQAVVSTLTFGSDIDQISVDGKGHLFAADASGSILFVDYATSGLVGTPQYTFSQGGFGGIDDLAPLSGLGAAVPEPTTIAAAVTGVLGGLVMAVRRRRAA